MATTAVSSPTPTSALTPEDELIALKSEMEARGYPSHKIFLEVCDGKVLGSGSRFSHCAPDGNRFYIEVEKVEEDGIEGWRGTMTLIDADTGNVIGNTDPDVQNELCSDLDEAEDIAEIDAEFWSDEIQKEVDEEEEEEEEEEE